MTTPTPRTDAVYLEHRYWANEDEATEAIEDLRDLARELERELDAERARLDWLEKARPIAWALGSEECGEYWILTDTGEKHPEEAEEFATLRAAIDAAMKEGTK